MVWERDAALAAVAETDHQAVTRALVDLTIAGASLDLLDLLEATRTRPDWSGPARDAAVYRYVEDLRELTPGSLDPAVLTYLKAWPANALVPNQDHPSDLIPLLNVRAAASGVENSWKRQEALLEGLALLRSNPESLADAFALEPDGAVRDGYRLALVQAPPAALASLNRAAAQRLANMPELTPLFAEAASLSGEVNAHLAVLKAGRGAPVAAMLRQFSGQAGLPAQRELLLESLHDTPATNTALAIAELAPALVGSSPVDQALIGILSDPALGASAALALSRSGAPATVEALEALAQGGAGPAATRARLALELQRERRLQDRS